MTHYLTRILIVNIGKESATFQFVFVQWIPLKIGLTSSKYYSMEPNPKLHDYTANLLNFRPWSLQSSQLTYILIYCLIPDHYICFDIWDVIFTTKNVFCDLSSFIYPVSTCLKQWLYSSRSRHIIWLYKVTKCDEKAIKSSLLPVSNILL